MEALEKAADSETFEALRDLFHEVKTVNEASAAIRALEGVERSELATTARALRGGKAVPAAEGGAEAAAKGGAKRWPSRSGDPAYERFGPARASHPELLEETLATVEKSGAKVIERPGALAYQPSSVPGKPGELYLDPDASMSAILHEVQHLTDDMARGFPGKEVLYQPNVRWAMESKAYSRELALARRAQDEELVKELIRLRTQEWRRIYMPDLEQLGG